MKAVVAAFNQKKALVGAFSVITNLRMELFQALMPPHFLSPSLEKLDSIQRGAGTSHATEGEILENIICCKNYFRFLDGARVVVSVVAQPTLGHKTCAGETQITLFSVPMSPHSTLQFL